MSAAVTSAREGILLVEDDDSIRVEVAELLAEEGYRVHQASNGKEALAQLRGVQRPCVILLDLMMPVMNGWGFRAAQRADASLASVPVIVLTGMVDGEREARSLGAAEYLRKPFDARALLEAVRRHCGAGDARAEAAPRGSQPSDPLASPASGALGGVRVLVVDDDDDARELFTMTLEFEGAEVRSAGDSREAMRTLVDWLPDIIVSDLVTPSAGGVDFLHEVRAVPALRRVEAIAVTGMAHAAADARAGGFRDVLIKPVDGDVLVDTVRRCVSR